MTDELCEECKKIIGELISGHEVELKLQEECLAGIFLSGNQLRIYAHFFERMKIMVNNNE